MESGEIVDILDQYSALQEPIVPINAFVQAVHGLNLVIFRGHALGVAHIAKNLRNAQFVLAHNVSFDKRFVSQLIPDAERINWLAQGIASRKREDIIRFYKTRTTARDRAVEDVYCTLEALQKSCVLSGVPHLLGLLT